MKRLVIVGSGLYGSLAKKLAGDGFAVTVIDAQLEHRASLCSAGLMKPSWASHLRAAEYRSVIQVLDDAYGVDVIDFTMRPSGKVVKVHRLDVVNKVLVQPDVVGKVIAIDERQKAVKLDTGELIYFDYLYLALGVWAGDLTPSVDVEKQWGQILKYKTQDTINPTICVWRPFKHAVTLPLGNNEFWFGDGLGAKTFSKLPSQDEFLARSRKYAEGLSGIQHNSLRIVGARPKVKAAPNGLFKVMTNGIFVGTGGAKNGALSGTIAALRLKSELEKEENDGQ